MNRSFLSCISGSLFASIFLASCGGGSSSGGGSQGVGSPGGGASNQIPVFTSVPSANLMEGSTDAFYTIVADDPDSAANPTISLATSGDGAFFTLDPQTLTVSAIDPLDFETPSDLNADNIYELVFTATDDAGGRTNGSVNVTVTDILESVGFNLDPSKAPSENFDLTRWKLQLPINDAGELSGSDSDEVSESNLNAGYESAYFYTGSDGAMVFRVPDEGATTSANTRYTRTELREMLRAGNTSISTQGVNENNWVLSSASQTNQNLAGGVNGVLEVTMAVNSVIEGGENFQKGRIIIGQIHAGTSEPIRLYYRKLPDNSRGSIYAIHENDAGDDQLFEIVGSADNDAPNPASGFLLDELFSYRIDADGMGIDVDILNSSGAEIGSTYIDMANSGYDDGWMYFKLGAYQVASYADNSLNIDEFTQLSVYALSSSHD